MSNVLPGETSYRPAKSIAALTPTAADARITGIVGTDTANRTKYVFAGNASKLYQLQGQTLTDRSKTGGDSTATGERWIFAVFGTTILASNYSDPIQAWQVGTSTAWADLSGTPPKARAMAVVRDFLVTGDIIESSVAYENRVRWSSIGDETNWTIGTSTQSDFQTIFDGGNVQAITGGEFGLILCKRSITRMDYVGSPLIFQFDQIAANRGLAARDAVTRVGATTYWLDHDGFYSFDGARINPIGFGKVNRFFWEDVKRSALERTTCAADPINGLICWSYVSNSSTEPDRVLVYNYIVDRWAKFDEDHTLVGQLVTPDATLEELDSVDANLDNHTASLDSAVYRGGDLQLATATTDHKIATFSGPTLGASIDTPEAALAGPRKSLVRGVRPVVTGGTLTAQIASRDRLNDVEGSFSTASSQNVNGICPLRSNGRYHKTRINIAAGSIWDHAVGLEIDFIPSGVR